MTPFTAHLVYCVRIATAAGYAPLALATGKIALTRLADAYKTSDIIAWARARVENILAEAARLRLLFAADEDLVRVADEALAVAWGVLEGMGYVRS